MVKCAAAILAAVTLTATAEGNTWLRDLSQAAQKAKRTGKPMVLVFGQSLDGKTC